MAKLKSLNSTVSGAWAEYGGWIILIVVGYVLFSFRKLFSVVGGGVGDAAEAALAKTKADAEAKVAQVAADSQKKADKLKAQTAAGTKTAYSDSQIATFRADAKSMAGYLGQLNLGMATVFKDQASAFSLIKQKYSRLMLVNNKPYIKVSDNGNGTAQVKNVTVETAACVKNPVNYKVLAPFYDEVTNGRNLVADFRYFVTSSQYTPFFKWIL